MIRAIIEGRCAVMKSPWCRAIVQFARARVARPGSCSSSAEADLMRRIARAVQPIEQNTSDTLPATDCVGFADGIKSGGLKVTFSDVPVLNRTGKVAQVTLDFRR
jgi:hypothetical protein